MKKIIVTAVAAGGIFLCGCVSLGEKVHGVLGTSIREIEASRVKSVKLTVPGSYDTAYDDVLAELKKEGRYIYRQERKEGLIAFYMSNENTTVAGVFLRELEGEKTEIEIASPSSFSRNILREKLSVLVPPPAPAVPEVESPEGGENGDMEGTEKTDEQEPAG